MATSCVEKLAGSTPAERPPNSAVEVERITRGLVAARERGLRHRPIADVLASLAAAVEQWFGPRSSFRERAEAELPALTGFSPAMVRHGLPLMLQPLRGDAIGRLLDAELGDRRVLDRHPGPPLIHHIVSGNLPALAATPLALSLAVKSAVVVKVSHRDRLFASLFIDSLRAVDAALAQCAAALYWQGGRIDLEAAAFRAADVVIAFGSDATIADVGRRVAGRFIGHGHRVSLAVITRAALANPEPVARRLAYDVSVWDQQGCLSPQIAYVECGGAIGVERFVETVAQELERLAEEIPPRRLSFEDKAAIRRFRQEAEWRGVRGEEVAVLTPTRGLRWTVVYDAAPAFVPTPLNRTIWVKPIDTVAQLPALLAPVHHCLEAAGIAAPECEAQVTAMLSRAGMHRVCRLGEMQRPDLSWRQGGRPRVAEWLAEPARPNDGD